MKIEDDKNKALIQNILAGDKRGFQTLIEQHQRLVGHIVLRLISNATDREDVCQDVFLKIYQHLASFQFESKLSTWIARIAYNTCINYLEKKRIPLFEDLFTGEVSVNDFGDSNNLPDEYTERVDLAHRIQKEIKQLPLQFQTILTLFHLDEMSYREIGEIMSLPEGTVKSYLFRARKCLKERLLEQYQPEELCQLSI